MYKKALAGLTGMALTALLATPAAADTWRDSQYWLEDYGFTTAWETTRGEGVTVGVIDTGIDDAHQDLTGQIVGGFDVSGVGDANGTRPLGPDPNHGTMVASLIAGHGHGELPELEDDDHEEDAEEADDAGGGDDAEDDGNGDDRDNGDAEGTDADAADKQARAAIDEFGANGILGTAPEADLLSVSVLLDDGAPEAPSVDQQIADGMIWLVNQGADIINISLASSAQDWPESWDEAFLHAEQHDVVVVAAAGNRASGSDVVGAPATIPGVLTVAGVDRDGKASWDASTEGITIGVAAPADPLIGAVPDDEYTQWSGTSGAAPLVTGLAALIRSEYPTMSAPQVINQILSTAQDTGEAGQDNLYGHGIIDAQAALATEVPPVQSNPMGSIADWITLHRRGEIEEPETETEEHEVAGPVDYPTELPVAAQLEEQPSVLQPLVVLGFGGLLLAALLIAVFFMWRQRSKHESS